MHEPTLRYCAKGSQVVRLQLMLRELGFTLEPDGFFGSMTREAVKTFQSINALPADGSMTPQAWSMLEARYNEHRQLTESGVFCAHITGPAPAS